MKLMHVDIDSVNNLNELYPPFSDENLYLVLDFPKYAKENITDIVKKAKEIIDSGIKLSIIIQAEHINFSEEDFKIFISLEDKLKEIGVPLNFDGGYKETYTLDEVIKADKKLDSIIDRINKSPLSPLERYLYIYNFLSRKEYKYNPLEKEDETRDEYGYLPRDIISVINSDYIVCVGYAELNKYLCRNVGIECRVNHLAVINTEGFESHMNNIVYIKDDKYGIDGLFYSDACWDNDAKKRTYSFALVPISDINRLASIAIRFEDSNILFLNSASAIFGYVEGKQGMDIVHPEYVDDKPSLVFEELANELNIKDKLVDIVNESLDVFKTRLNCIDRLISFLKEREVPEDIYNNLFSNSCSTSLPFLLASCMLGNNDKILNRSVDILLKEKRESDFLGEFNSSNVYFDIFDKVINYNVSNVYRTLEEIKSFDSKEYDMSFLELFDKVSKIKEKRSIEEGTNNTDYDDYLHHDMIFEIIYHTVEEIKRMLTHIYFQTTILKKYSPFVTLDPKALKEALINVYMFEGLSEIDAKEKVDESIVETDKINKLAYSEKAYSYSWLDELKK